MIAKDVMTAKIVSVGPDTGVRDIARLLVEKRISAVPVVDDQDRIVGIVSEGDLIHRPESGTEERHRPWWLDLFATADELATAYSKAHGLHAADVMTREVVTVEEDTPLEEIARILEEAHIKRVPVVRDGRPVGIVSRANLLHGLASDTAPAAPPALSSDRAIREALLAALRKEPWASPSHVNATVAGGVVHLWGLVETDEEIGAYGIAAGQVPGVKSVENHMQKIDSRILYRGDS